MKIARNIKLVSLLAAGLLLAACGQQQQPETQAPVPEGHVAISVNLGKSSLSTQDLSALGSPYAQDGSIAVNEVRVAVTDKNNDPVHFDLSGSTYTVAASGPEQYISLDPADPNASVVLLAAGNPYTFTSLGYDAATTANVIAYDEQSQNIANGTSVEVALESVLGDAVLMPRYPTNYAVAGQVLDLMLVVMANGNDDIEGDYLQVPLGDFAVDYTVVTGATELGASNRGIRLQVGATCSTAVEVDFGVTGLRAPDYSSGRDDHDYEIACATPVNGGIGVDVTNPVVSLTSYDAVSGLVTGTASDNHGIAKVEIWDGPILLASTDDGAGVALITFTPGTNNFSATLATAPTGAISIVAFDIAGNQSEAGATVTVGSGGMYATIQEGVNAVAAMGGGVVEVQNGTYTGFIDIRSSGITLRGESETGTVIDNSGLSGYGIQVFGDNVTLENFTLTGPGAGQGYGINAQANPAASDILEGLRIRNVTVQNSRSSEIVLNTARNAVLENVTANGGNTEGVGVAITGSTGVTLNNVNTSGNKWGGIALFTTNNSQNFSINNTSDITVDGGTRDEVVEIYSQYYGTKVFSNLNLSGFNYAVRNPDHKGGGESYVFYFQNLEDAVAYAVWLPNASSSTIQRVSSSDASILEEEYLVESGMSIQGAVSAAQAGGTIRLAGTTFAEQITIDKSVEIQGQSGTVISAPATMLMADNSYSIVSVIGTGTEAQISDVTVSGPFPGHFSCEAEIAAGIRVASGALLNLSDSSVTKTHGAVGSDGLFYCSHAVGLMLGYDETGDLGGHANLTNVHFSEVDKFAIMVANPGAALNFNGGTITTTPSVSGETARYGIGVHNSASANVTGVTIRGYVYVPATWTSAAILLIDAGVVELQDNVLEDNMMGIAADGATQLIAQNNRFANNTWHLYDWAATLDLDLLFDANTFPPGSQVNASSITTPE